MTNNDKINDTVKNTIVLYDEMNEQMLTQMETNGNELYWKTTNQK